MKLPLSQPKHAFDKSWMANPDQVRRLDSDVRVLLATARKNNRLAPCEPPVSVDVLVENVRRGVRYKRWFLVSTACALLGELLYGAPEGKRYSSQSKPPRQRPEREGIHAPLRAFRNACCHPAQVAEEKGEGLAVEILVKVLEKMPGYGGLGPWLAARWSRLYEPPLAAWAIRQVDRAGRHELDGSVPRY